MVREVTALGLVDGDIGLFYCLKSDDVTYLAVHPEMLAVSVGVDIVPTIRLSPDTASKLMDDLWRLGVRPSDK